MEKRGGVRHLTSDRFRLQVDSRMGGEETVTARLWAVLKGVVKFERGGVERRGC